MALKQTQISKMVSPNKGLKIWAEHLISLSILQIKGFAGNLILALPYVNVCIVINLLSLKSQILGFTC